MLQYGPERSCEVAPEWFTLVARLLHAREITIRQAKEQLSKGPPEPVIMAEEET